MIGAAWKEYPKGVQVVLVFMTVCLEMYILRVREVHVYCLKIAFSLVKKEYVLFF